uniref:5'-nucleotidase n=1 Tax=Eptatretus burgeri TaxID=7764 RepID=A0A8C4QXE5_EPTBU
MERGTAIRLGATASAGLVALFGGALLAQYVLNSMKGKDKKTKIIEMIPEFQSKKVHIQDPDRVEHLICSLIKGGASKLQVVSDFDMTLSRFSFNGKRCSTCHNVIDKCKLFTEEAKKELSDLKDKYYPIEMDPKLSNEDKFPFMVEWWTKAHGVMSQLDIRKDKLAVIVQESDAMLRDGCDVFLNALHAHNVPLIVLSAGLGDILEEIIGQANLFLPNIHIIANYMDFDEKGRIKGFKGEMIHTYNKRDGALRNSPYFHLLRNNSNVILLGDTMGDLSMADGIPNVQNVLKIGFLNDKMDGLLETFLAAYDIVLVQDETLDLVNAILQKCCLAYMHRLNKGIRHKNMFHAWNKIAHTMLNWIEIW